MTQELLQDTARLSGLHSVCSFECMLTTTMCLTDDVIKHDAGLGSCFETMGSEQAPSSAVCVALSHNTDIISIMGSKGKHQVVIECTHCSPQQ